MSSLNFRLSHGDTKKKVRLYKMTCLESKYRLSYIFYVNINISVIKSNTIRGYDRIDNSQKAGTIIETNFTL